MTATATGIRAVCLDLDDTLWPVAPVIRQAEQDLQDWLLAHYPDIARQVSPQDMRRRLALFLERLPEHAHDMTLVRRSLLTALAREAGHPESVGEEAFEVFFTARNRVRLYDDVLPALDWLGSRYPLVAVTNGNADLARVGLDHYFVASVQARQVGVPKPRKAIFDVAVEWTGVPRHQVLHVGDDVETDVLGARRAGLRSAWVNRRGESWPAEEAPPEFLVSDLQSLVKRLAGDGD